MSRVRICIRHRGRNRRFRRMLHAVQEVGGVVTSTVNGRRTAIEAEFPSVMEPVWLALHHQSHAIDFHEI